MADFTSVNPATGEELATYPTATAAEVEQALEKAFNAFKTWTLDTTVAERAKLLARVAELHEERKDELGKIAAQEMGKPIEQAVGEVEFSAAIFQYYADNAEELLKDQPIDASTGGYAVIRRQALGPLLGVMPWNYPYYQVARFAAPNIALGNPILLKHAASTPGCALAIAKIFEDANAPEGVYQNLFLSHDQIEPIIADDRVRGVSLTGSERAGAIVAEQAGRHLKRVVLELGGADPFFVLDVDDLDEAVEAGVAGRMENSGQACNASKRHIVLAKDYDAYVEKFTEKITSLQGGDPTQEGQDYGPMSSLKAAEGIEEQLKEAVAAGANLVGGERDGAFIKPGVLTNVTPDNPVFTQEIFGPIAMIFSVENVDEAIELANNSPFGLGAIVFSNNQETIDRIADEHETGMVYVNEVGGELAELPFGGVKNSGSGRELGPIGIDEFVNKKLVRIKERPSA